MITSHAVGIDLGTTYSCISYLNEHGEPVTLPNQEGELSTPSVILFDDYEVVVGTEALRQSIIRPDRVIQNSKRHMGDPHHRWTIDGNSYTPTDIATFILKKLLSAAEERIGKIEQAVITVPAQFSDGQRQATVDAGLRAGLKRVDVINEPVAAALCHVLGTEGLWFTELAEAQRILVYDLGGGTFDLSLVKYEKNEVTVIASSGDLNLGGIDWNAALERAVSEQFQKDFGEDLHTDPESRQFLALEVEQAKRSLTVRPRTALSVQHAGHRKTYQIEQARFEKLTKQLVDRTEEITKAILKDNKMGWAHVDAVLTTGGSSRMPMIRDMLKRLSGRTLNTSLSPDQSIAHGATYYAGMLLTNNEFAKSILSQEASSRLAQVKQRSVNARALGILIRDKEKKKRLPHYLVPANSPLPASAAHTFGTVVPDQRRVHLHIVESGTSPDQPYVKLGACIIEDLPAGLPEKSQIEVTISYDDQARVHVSAIDVASGKQATTEIVRSENIVARPVSETEVGPLDSKRTAPPAAPKTTRPVPAVAAPSIQPAPNKVIPAPVTSAKPAVRPAPAPKVKVVPSPVARRSVELEDAGRPIPLCNDCGEPLDPRGHCPVCPPSGKSTKQSSAARPRKVGSKVPSKVRKPESSGTAGRPRPVPVPPPLDDDEILDLNDDELVERSGKSTSKPPSSPGKGKAQAGGPPPVVKKRKRKQDPGEDEFWNLD
jgi:molecular chaperone DnaK